MAILNKLRQMLGSSKTKIQNETSLSKATPSTTASQESKPEGPEADAAEIEKDKVLLYVNKKALDLLRSNDIDWAEAVSFFMVKSFGEQSELEISSDRVTLSTVSKVRCQTTPMYRDKTGGIYVLFEEADAGTRQRAGLENLGTIDPMRYALTLCAKFRIEGKKVYA